MFSAVPVALISILIERRSHHHQIASCSTRIVVSDDHIALKINTENPSVDLARIQHDLDAIKRNGVDVTLIIAARLERQGAGHMITAPDEKSIFTTLKSNQPPLRNLAQAHEWCRAMGEGAISLVHDIAAAAKCDKRYVHKLLRLTYLAPDIVDAILDGRQPASFQLKQLTDPKLTLDWTSQRAAIVMTT